MELKQPPELEQIVYQVGVIVGEIRLSRQEMNHPLPPCQPSYQPIFEAVGQSAQGVKFMYCYQYLT